MGLGSLIRKIPVIGNPIENTVESVLTPGAAAAKKASQATDAWKGLEVPQTPNLTEGPQTTEQGTGIGNALDNIDALRNGGTRDAQTGQISAPGDINPYDVGAPLQQTDYGQSAASGMTNAYNGLTSAYGGLNSAFDGTQSAATGMQYDPNAAQGQRNAASYFGKLSQTGSDPIAEADYQKRAAQAEQGRKADTDAALQQMEMRGQGNAGGNLSALTGGIQDATNAKYQAGLDTTAAAAGRRDTAANAGATINANLGGALEKTANDKAAAEDKYNFYKLSGMDDMAAKKASGLDQFEQQQAAGTNSFQQGQASLEDAYGSHAKDVQHSTDVANWNRTNTAHDANTDLKNQTNTFNKVTAPQTTFGNQVTKTGGVTGALGNEGATSLAGNQALTSNLKEIGGGIAGLGGGGGAAAAPGAAPAYSAPAQVPGAAGGFHWPTSANPTATNPQKFY